MSWMILTLFLVSCHICNSMQLDVEEGSKRTHANDEIENSFRRAKSLKLDVDDGSRTQSGLLSGSDSSWLPNGPSDMQSMWRWASPMVSRFIEQSNGESWEGLLQNNICKLTLSTDFSGIGFPEAALSMLTDAWHEMNPDTCMDIVFWRACDILPHCRRVHVEGESRHTPKHVFGDITKILPNQFVEAASAILAQARTDILDAVQTRGLVKSEAVNGHGRIAMHTLMEMVKALPRSASLKMPCCKHSPACCNFFGPPEVPADMITLAIAGSGTNTNPFFSFLFSLTCCYELLYEEQFALHGAAWDQNRSMQT